MQVGSEELVFALSRPTNAQEVFEAIKRVWPHLRFEDSRAGKEAVSTRYVNRPGSVNFFLYRNYAAYRGVSRYGVEDYLAGEFLHVLIKGGKHVTLFLGGANRDIDQIVKSLESSWVREIDSVGVA